MNELSRDNSPNHPRLDELSRDNGPNHPRLDELSRDNSPNGSLLGHDGEEDQIGVAVVNEAVRVAFRAVTRRHWRSGRCLRGTSQTP